MPLWMRFVLTPLLAVVLVRLTAAGIRELTWHPAGVVVAPVLVLALNLYIFVRDRMWEVGTGHVVLLVWFLPWLVFAFRMQQRRHLTLLRWRLEDEVTVKSDSLTGRPR